MRGFVLPILLIGLGIYLLRDYFTKSKENAVNTVDFDSRTGQPMFVSAFNESNFQASDFDSENEVLRHKFAKRVGKTGNKFSMILKG